MRSVYVIKTSHDLYKIGIAKDVDSRMRSHQTSNGNKVLLVTYAKCGNALVLEKQVHSMLSEYKQPGGREWFKLTPEQAIKVCIYIHQKSELFVDEDEIRGYLDDFASVHKDIVDAHQNMESLAEKVGLDIEKSIGRLRRYKPAPKPPKIEKAKDDRDLYKLAVQAVIEQGKASTSSLQRILSIGYGRASRIIDELERQQVIGPADGSRPRTVLLSK